MNNLIVTVEYEDGHINVHRGSLRGIRRGSERPSYVTITATCSEKDFIWNGQARYYVYADIPQILKGGTTVRGRIICKPYWFHKLVNNKGN